MDYGQPRFKRNPYQRWVLLCTAILIFLGYSIEAFDGTMPLSSSPAQQPAKPDNCVVCHEKTGDETISLFTHSTHSRRGISCKDCHGGNSTAVEKSAAHGQDFIGKMTSNQILERCGSCHNAPLTLFQSGRHYPEGKKLARVDCVQCHGAHTVGKLSGGSALSYVCAGCHGLEYLPELPSDLQKTLVVTDEVRDQWRDAEAAGRKPSEEAVKLRRELRRMVGEWVHRTDVKSAQQNFSEFIERSNRLKGLLANQPK